MPQPDDFPLTEVRSPTYRLIPSRFPPVPAFEAVSEPADLEAVMALEGWTNDRLVATRLARLPRAQWVRGRANASVVMASFLHAPPAGQRFSDGVLGAWYAAYTVRTALIEVAHHLRREAAHSGLSEMRGTYRCYSAVMHGDHVDLRRRADEAPVLYDPDSYAAGQLFGERVRRAGGHGIVYDSVRHRGGTNAVGYRPEAIRDVIQGTHYELTVPHTGRLVARDLGSA